MLIDPGELNKLLEVEKKKPNTAFDGAGSDTWELLDQVWASVRDALPSKAERVDGGFNLATRPARVRMFYREDISGDMRFRLGSRIMQIVSGPAEIGDRDGIEFMVEDYGTAAGGA